MSAEKHIRRLERKHDFLETKVNEMLREEAAGGRHANQHTIAELAALDWALPLLRYAAVVEEELESELAKIT